MSQVSLSFLLTFLAGFSTLIGVLPIFFPMMGNQKFLSFILAFASGVMLCVSILDLLPFSIRIFSRYVSSFFVCLLCFFCLFIGIVFSRFLEKTDDISLYHVGTISLCAIFFHNILEGIITFVFTSKDIVLGMKVACAIFFHNIPEGISISVPIYYSTGSRKKAFFYTLVASLSEPIGGVITYLFLFAYMKEFYLSILFSIIAGIMIELSMGVLLPTSLRYGFNKFSYFGFLIGFLFMVLQFLF